MSRRGLVAALVAGAAWLGACGTCRPEQPRVEPRVGGGVTIGSSGVTPGLGIGLDVSNLFCRPPDPATQPQPGPADEPIPDLPSPEPDSEPEAVR